MLLIYDQVMQFPQYSGHDYPDYPPLEAYISHVAERGENQFEETNLRLMQASMLVGKACIKLAETDSRQELWSANEELRAVQDYARPLANYQDDRRGPARLLMSTVEIIKSRNDPLRMELMRKTLHDQVIDELAIATEQLSDSARLTQAEKRAHGRASEYTALALLTRMIHPRALVLPALPHQDAWVHPEIGAGFDIALIEAPYADAPSTTPNTATRIHKVQVKSGCLGFCNDSPTYHSLKTAGQYGSDIALISGHCDLNEEKSIDTPFTLPIADLLIAEAQGGLDDAVIQDLDYETNRLLLTVTGDERRRGTFQRAISIPRLSIAS